jgi:hypothetical protein
MKAAALRHSAGVTGCPRPRHLAEPPTQTNGKFPTPSLVFKALVGVDLNGAEILMGWAVEHFTQAIKA